MTTDKTPKRPNGFEILIALFFKFGNLKANKNPKRHGTIVNSKFENNAKYGTSIVNSFSVVKALPSPYSQVGIRTIEASVLANVIPALKSMSPLNFLRKNFL